jgi:hypothetical protein
MFSPSEDLHAFGRWEVKINGCGWPAQVPPRAGPSGLNLLFVSGSENQCWKKPGRHVATGHATTVRTKTGLARLIANAKSLWPA